MSFYGKLFQELNFALCNIKILIFFVFKIGANVKAETPYIPPSCPNTPYDYYCRSDCTNVNSKRKTINKRLVNSLF